MSDRANDGELVARAENGDSAAFEELVERHYAVVVTAGYVVLRDMDSARDCAQDAFLEAASTLGTLRDKAKFSAWIYGISRRKAIYVLRRQTLHREAMRAMSDEARSAGAVRTPSEQMGKNEKLASIRRALGELDEIYREVIVLKYIDGRSHEDIATLLEISLAAVDKRLMRGKEMLRESLQRWKVDE